MENEISIKKCGTVSLLGRANVGKSTLMNSIIGERIAIVSPKPQTTRTRVTGVLTRGESQYVFVDTPGLHQPKSKLGSIMVNTIYETAASVDAALLVITADGDPRVGKPERILLERVKEAGIPCVLAINKIDKCDKASLLPLISAYAEAYAFTDIVPVSALRNDGIDELLDCVAKLLPTLGEGENPLFASDDITDQPERLLASEFVRERLMCLLDKEIPHGVATVTEEFREDENGTLIISVAITCDKENHKGIIIGSHGALLKEIGSSARARMETLFGAKVYLNLWVRVRDDWRNNAYILRDLGYGE